MGGKGR